MKHYGMMPVRMLREHRDPVYHEDFHRGKKTVRWVYRTATPTNEFIIIHNEYGPALISYYENGNVEEEQYRIHGHLHRVDGPAITKYDESGIVICKQFFFLNEEIDEEKLFEPGFVQSIIGNISE